MTQRRAWVTFSADLAALENDDRLCKVTIWGVLSPHLLAVMKEPSPAALTHLRLKPDDDHVKDLRYNHFWVYRDLFFSASDLSILNSTIFCIPVTFYLRRWPLAYLRRPLSKDLSLHSNRLDLDLSGMADVRLPKHGLSSPLPSEKFHGSNRHPLLTLICP